jgi:hypothetical protein
LGDVLFLFEIGAAVNALPSMYTLAGMPGDRPEGTPAKAALPYRSVGRAA